MYEKLDRSGDGTLGYRVRDEISEADLEKIVRDLDVAIAEQGEVDLLVHVESFPKPELDALEEDLAFWREHGDDIGRYAVVADSTLLKWATKLGDKATEADVRYFEAADIEDAWNWVDGDA